MAVGRQRSSFETTIPGNCGLTWQTPTETTSSRRQGGPRGANGPVCKGCFKWQCRQSAVLMACPAPSGAYELVYSLTGPSAEWQTGDFNLRASAQYALTPPRRVPGARAPFVPADRGPCPEVRA